MDNRFMCAVFITVTGYTVIKACANCQHHISVGDSTVRTFVSMQAAHTQKLLTIGADAAQAHQRACYRQVHFFTQMHCLVFRTGNCYTAANKHHRAFSLVQRSYSCSNKLLLRHSNRQLAQLARMIFHHARLHVVRHIYKHRAGTSAFCHLKSQTYRLR